MNEEIITACDGGVVKGGKHHMMSTTAKAISGCTVMLERARKKVIKKASRSTKKLYLKMLYKYGR